MIPASVAIFGLIFLAVLYVILTDRRTRSRDDGGWLDEGEAQMRLYSSNGRSVLGTPRQWSRDA